MARGITSFRVPVDPLFSAVDREILATLIIEVITVRTRSGEDIDGNPFRQYSRAYRDDLRRDGLDTDPDLDVTGEMIDSIELLSSGEGFIEIGFQEGTEAANKATWNQGGNRRIPSRPFLGVPDDIIEVLSDGIMSSDPAIAAQRFLTENNLVGQIFNELGLQTQSLEVLEGFEGVTPLPRRRR